MAAPLWLIDSTLRDGEQSPGVAFHAREKQRLARMLDDVGVDEIEAGTPAMGVEECAHIRSIVRLKLRARISVWCRAVEGDIELAGSTDADGVHIAFPVSERQLRTMNKSWDWVKDTLPKRVEQALTRFKYVSVGAQDAGRCTVERLTEFMDIAGRSAYRIRIADTVGRMTPLEVMQLMQYLLRSYPDLSIDFHAHNDFGMATANALTAWQSGATALSVTVNGLGERSGNAALEEVVMMLSQQFGHTRFITRKLNELCGYTALISRRPVPVNKPVCGACAFTHESGIHVKGSMSDILSYQAFDGRLAGRESFRYTYGVHSGSYAVVALLEQHGITQIKESDVTLLLEQIRRKARLLKRSLESSEVINIYLTHLPYIKLK